MSKEEIYIPMILLLFVPNITLVTLHLDQCLYPVLFLTPICLYVYGILNDRMHLMMLAGIASYMAFFVSFSQIVLIPLLCIITSLLLFHRKVIHTNEPLCSMRNKTKIWLATKAIGLFSVGFISTYAIFFEWLNFNGLRGYLWAISRHQVWKIQTWDLKTTLYIGFLDIIEYVIWIGIPISLLFGLSVINAFIRLIRNSEVRYIDIMSVSLFVIVLLMAFAGKTVAETARLWIFIIPLIAIPASKEILWLFENKRKLGLFFVVFFQFISIFMIKMYHDFN